jgi:NAD(P)H-dependent flavin oxidoreductase YrpB (nitropropane dioxygenase family)
VRRLSTALCDRLGMDLPIVKAPVGSAAGPELVAAVSEAGGLGVLALTWQSPDQARHSIRVPGNSPPGRSARSRLSLT